MKSAIIELQYFPSVSFFAVLQQFDKVLIEQHDNYQKRTYRNRCHIASANGLLRLSVPLEKGKNSQLNVREVKIANDYNWQTQHWQTIQSAYGNAPYFEYYKDEILPIFQQEYTFLFDLNLALLDVIRDLLIHEMPYQLTDSYEQKNDTFTDFRNQFTPKFHSNQEIKPKPHTQLFLDKNGFIPNLSILDLLFCKGPESLLYLRDFKLL